MRRRELRVALRLVAAIWLLGFGAGVRAQAPGVNPRPQAGPFDPSQMLSEAPPAAGVAIKAGRMFDSASGKMLTNQVILVKGDRITDVGPADMGGGSDVCGAIEKRADSRRGTARD